MERVLLATLTHNGLIDGEMATAFFNAGSPDRFILDLHIHPTSLLAAGYNHIWCKALNERKKHNWRYLAILHADIVPEIGWLDKIIDQADHWDADVMSAVVPIKNYLGVTSTAISRPGDNFSCYSRLTQAQVNDSRMPKSFDIHTLTRALSQQDPLAVYQGITHKMPVPDNTYLLVNTGCCVIRIDRDWCEKADFTINDRILKRRDGSFTYEVESEDWYFSRRVAELGGRVMATTAVKLDHIGRYNYPSNQIWGHNYDPSTPLP